MPEYVGLIELNGEPAVPMRCLANQHDGALALVFGNSLESAENVIFMAQPLASYPSATAVHVAFDGLAKTANRLIGAVTIVNVLAESVPKSTTAGVPMVDLDSWRTRLGAIRDDVHELTQRPVQAVAVMPIGDRGVVPSQSELAELYIQMVRPGVVLTRAHDPLSTALFPAETAVVETLYSGPVPFDADIAALGSAAATTSRRAKLFAGQRDALVEVMASLRHDGAALDRTDAAAHFHPTLLDRRQYHALVEICGGEQVPMRVSPLWVNTEGASYGFYRQGVIGSDLAVELWPPSRLRSPLNESVNARHQVDAYAGMAPRQFREVVALDPTTSGITIGCHSTESIDHAVAGVESLLQHAAHLERYELVLHTSPTAEQEAGLARLRAVDAKSERVMTALADWPAAERGPTPRITIREAGADPGEQVRVVAPVVWPVVGHGPNAPKARPQ